MTTDLTLTYHLNRLAGTLGGPSATRAGPGTVGFLGNPASLTTINPLDSLTGTPLDGIGSWDGDVLRINGSDVTVQDCLLNTILYHGSGTNMTVQNCIINAPAPGDPGSGFSAISQSSVDRGTLTVLDCTITCATAGTSVVSTAVASEYRMIMRRCDVSGSGDGIHTVGIPGSTYTDGSIIDSCYIHDLSFLDEAQHLDAIQLFNADVNNTTTDTFCLIQNCRTDASYGPSGEAMNSGLTVGTSPDDQVGLKIQAKIDNNAFNSGAYHLRVGYRTANVQVTGNNFGTFTPSGPHAEFGLVDVSDPTAITLWKNNRTATGFTVTFPGVTDTSSGAVTESLVSAANIWAGTSGLSLAGALNVKAGTTGLTVVACLNSIAGTTGLTAVDAASRI